MKKSKRARLEAHGWRFGSAADFLTLTSEEAAFVETKLKVQATTRYLHVVEEVARLLGERAKG